MGFLKGLRGGLEIVGVLLVCAFVFFTGFVVIARWLTWFMEQLA